MFWIWFSKEIREHNPRFRFAALIFCGIMVAAGLTMIGLVLIQGTDGMSILFLGGPIREHPPAWIMCTLSFVFVLIHMIPMIVLLDPATRSHFDASIE